VLRGRVNAQRHRERMDALVKAFKAQEQQEQG
jgi:hypothetical protein